MKCSFCKKGTLQFIVETYSISIYGKLSVSIKNNPRNICCYCGESFKEDTTLATEKIQAFKYLSNVFQTELALTGTVAGWIRINLQKSRDEISDFPEQLKELEQNDKQVPDLIKNRLLELMRLKIA